MTPKCHFALHFAQFVRQWGFLPNVLPLERKRKVPKRYADPCKNPDNNYARIVLRETTCHHLSALTQEHFNARPRVLRPGPGSAKMRAMLSNVFGVAVPCGRSVRVNEYEVVSVDDVVWASVGHPI